MCEYFWSRVDYVSEYLLLITTYLLLVVLLSFLGDIMIDHYLLFIDAISHYSSLLLFLYYGGGEDRSQAQNIKCFVVTYLSRWAH